LTAVDLAAIERAAEWITVEGERCPEHAEARTGLSKKAAERSF
jgi:hypothetical protein